MSRFVVIGAQNGPGSFPSRAAARRWIADTYRNDHPLHVTPSAPGEVDLRRVSEDTFEVSGTWVGPEPILLTIAPLRSSNRRVLRLQLIEGR